MEVLRSSLIRAVCSLIVGVLLIQYPDATVTWITVAIGSLFVLSGVISCVAYIVAVRTVSAVDKTGAYGLEKRPGKPLLPVVGLGSIILGALLVLKPSFFVSWLMYVLGAMLILGAIIQFMALVSVRRYASFSFFYWVCPSLVLLVGLYVMVKPMESAAMPLVIIGWCSLLYGVTEAVNAVKIYSWKKRADEASRGDGDSRA